jgi:hypothetical protein
MNQSISTSSNISSPLPTYLSFANAKLQIRENIIIKKKFFIIKLA